DSDVAGQGRLAGVERPIDRTPQVVRLRKRQLEPLAELLPLDNQVGGFGDGEEELGATPADLVRFGALVEPLRCVLADRLEHPEALVRIPEQALLDERLERLDVRVAHPLGGVQRATAREDTEAPEEALLAGSEKIVAPFECRPQRRLSRLRVPASPEQ